MKKLLLALVVPLLIFAAPRALHITFHKGCAGEVEYICKQLGVEVDSWCLLHQASKFLDGESRPQKNYIMTKERARKIYMLHKDTFNSYDLIITSDIAPLSRIFLQHNWKKPLLIWVCNRFDINAYRSGERVFPDKQYLKLFQKAKDLPNVEIVGYTKYEAVHARKHRGVTAIEKTIEPTGYGVHKGWYQAVPDNIDKSGKVFIRNYRNEIKLNIRKILQEKDIPYYLGQYNGSADLADFIGMVHIPLVMGNLHLWENLKEGIVHFIPSKQFYRKLYSTRQIEFWDWTNPSSFTGGISADEIFANCDWYDERLAPLLVFFDSFDHLKVLLEETDYTEKKRLMKTFHKEHTEECLSAWRSVFSNLIDL